jgi:hypothetical protein
MRKRPDPSRRAIASGRGLTNRRMLGIHSAPPRESEGKACEAPNAKYS